MRRIELLITDLNGVLDNWAGRFAGALEEMIAEAHRISGIDRNQLIGELRQAHARIGSIEQPFILLELPSVRSRFGELPQDELRHRLAPALEAHRRATKEPNLYAGVAETLRLVRARQIPIVVHTESTAIDAASRLAREGIAPYIDALVVCPFLNDERPGAFYEALGLRAVTTPHRKPNPQILLDICAMYDIAPVGTLFVGDSAIHDIAMAKAAGTRLALATYGSCNEEQRELLVAVTHWKEEHIKREMSLSMQCPSPIADVELHAFSDLIAYIDAVK